jgi:hypothetical protein
MDDYSLFIEIPPKLWMIGPWVLYPCRKMAKSEMKFLLFTATSFALPFNFDDVNNVR